MKSFAQGTEGSNLYVAVGIHAGILGAINDYQSVPYQIHVDKLLPKRNVIGLGYSYDKYKNTNSFFWGTGGGSENNRHNLRLRYYRYFRNEDLRVSSYYGCSIGISIWEQPSALIPKYGYDSSGVYQQMGYYERPTSYDYLPSAQFIIGFKVKITEAIFWQTEVSFGSPYLAQTSLGIKF